MCGAVSYYFTKHAQLHFIIVYYVFSYFLLLFFFKNFSNIIFRKIISTLFITGLYVGVIMPGHDKKAVQ